MPHSHTIGSLVLACDTEKGGSHAVDSFNPTTMQNGTEVAPSNEESFLWGGVPKAIIGKQSLREKKKSRFQMFTQSISMEERRFRKKTDICPWLLHILLE